MANPHRASSRQSAKPLIDRRTVMRTASAWVAASVLLTCDNTTGWAAKSASLRLQRRFDRKLEALRKNTKLLEEARTQREGQSLTSPFVPGLKRAPSRPEPSQTPISTRAIDLIVACEVTSQKAYIRRYQRPTWPKGQSGVTVGIGYDIGYVTREWLTEDWRGYLPEDLVEALMVACGATGARAHQLTQSLQQVVIEWPAAQREFAEIVLPRTIGETEAVLPNTNLLPPDALGALVSLDYNRGPSFGSSHPGDRYREMRAIKAHMAAKEFSKIPGEIRSMKRLWRGNRNMAGLIERRELEAILFELGLQESSRPQTLRLN
jgi:GH24 family phage-related lysozyme (muramidase)